MKIDTAKLNKHRPHTRLSTSNALDRLAEWFPEHAATINRYKPDLIEHIFNGTRPDADSPLGKMTFKASAAMAHPMDRVAPQVLSEDYENLGISPCLKAVAGTVVSGVLFGVSLFGLHTVATDFITRDLVTVMGNNLDKVRYIYILTERFKKAEGLWDTAMSIFGFLGAAYNLGGFKVVLKHLMAELSWFDWVETGVIAIAQFTLWFASDGLAFIGEAIMVLDSAGNFIDSAIRTCVTCFSSPDPDITPTGVKETFTPKGSYLASATGVDVEFSAVFLTGHWWSQPYRTCTMSLTTVPLNADIDYIDDRLQTTAWDVRIPPVFTPYGHYRQSLAFNPRTELRAALRDKEGTLVHSSLDITNLPVATTLANIDGVLTVAIEKEPKAAKVANKKEPKKTKAAIKKKSKKTAK